MSQMKTVVDPFGEVNVRIARGGRVSVSATILMQPHKEGAQTGIAIDGSGSMADLYGMNSGGAVSSVFATRRAVNVITPVAQKICAYLARNVDADGGTTCIYWATGPAGSEVEVVGDLTADQADGHVFRAPTRLGTGTQLLPAVRYFVERFESAPYGFYVFITDGAIHDLDEVKDYTVRLAERIAARKRNPLKFVLVGIGREVDEQQMEELDDLEAPVDLWDHKLASELRVLEQIFAEVVDRNVRVAPSGRILDPSGTVLKDYSDVGMPAVLEFTVPASIPYFTLEVPGFRIHQPLFEGAKVPVREETAPFAEPVDRPKGPPPLPGEVKRAVVPLPDAVAQPVVSPAPQAAVPIVSTTETTTNTAPAVAARPTPAEGQPTTLKAEKESPDRVLENLDEMEPTLPGLDFKLEFDNDRPDIDLDVDKK